MKSFIISSLLAAGLPETGNEFTYQEKKLKIEEGIAVLLTQELPFTLAGHSSHRSHRSHGSHRSHRSSNGGGSSLPKSYSPPVYTPPSNRNKNSTPNSSILPSNPTITIPKLKGNSAAFIELTRKIQMMLFALGFYTGAIDGVVGSETSSAISAYQLSKGLSITGKINDELVRSLGVPIQ